jgi:hypothetical protein
MEEQNLDLENKTAKRAERQSGSAQNSLDPRNGIGMLPSQKGRSLHHTMLIDDQYLTTK